MQDREILKEVIGLTEEAAFACCKGQGYSTRVVSEDGQHFIVTCDAISNRVNLDMVNGKVVSAHFG